MNRFVFIFLFSTLFFSSFFLFSDEVIFDEKKSVERDNFISKEEVEASDKNIEIDGEEKKLENSMDEVESGSYEILVSDYVEDKKFLDYIGLDLEKCYLELGVPVSIDCSRGERPIFDDVFMFHSSGFYSFWYDNHIWQLGFSLSYKESIFGIKMGSSLYSTLNHFGVPFSKTESELFYRLSSTNFPLMMRLIFRGNILEELYIYRADL